MHIASIKGDYKIVKLLIIYGADPNLKSINKNYTPLDYAFEANQQKCISILSPLLANDNNNNKNNKKIQSTDTGLKTTKNLGSQIDNIRDEIDFNDPHIFNNQNFNSKKSNVLNGKTEEIKDSEYSDNVVINNGTNNLLSTSKNFNELRDSNIFINEMFKFEKKLEKCKQELNIGNNINEFYHSPNLNSTNNDSKFHNNSKHHKHNSNIENINLDKLWQNLGKSSKDELNKNNKKVENSKNYNESFFIRGTHNLNIDELVNINQSNKKNFKDDNEMYLNNLHNDSNNENNNNIRNFTFYNYNKNKEISLKPEEKEGINSVVINQSNSRISYNTSNNQEENSSPPRYKVEKTSQTSKNSYPMKFIENCFEQSEIRSKKIKKKIIEYFEDKEKILAIFTSAKNDIMNGEKEEEQYRNQYEEVINKAQNLKKKETFKSNNSQFTDQNINNNLSTRKNERYLRKNKPTNEEIKVISLYSNSVNDNEVLIYKNSHDINNISNLKDINFSENYIEIYNLLKSINLHSFTDAFVKNGFDDLNIIKEQMMSNSPITDSNLKKIGIIQAGYRARILIKLEEGNCKLFIIEAKLFEFEVPLSVYYNVNIDKEIEWKSIFKIK